MKDAGSKAILLAAVIVVGALLAGPASAGSEGHRNTAAILGGAAMYQLIQGEGPSAALLGAGAAIAYDQYREDKRMEECYGYGYGYRCPREYRGEGYRWQRCGGCHRMNHINRCGFCALCVQHRIGSFSRLEPCRHCGARTYCNVYHLCRRCADQQWAQQDRDRYRRYDRERVWDKRREREQYRYRQDRDRDRDRSTPPGWDRGRKMGWRN